MNNAIPNFQPLLAFQTGETGSAEVLVEACETLFTYVRETLSQLQGNGWVDDGYLEDHPI